MANSLFPAYVEYEMTSPFGPHSGILPLGFRPDFGATATLTTIETWDGGLMSLPTMVTNMVNALANYYTSDSVFTLYSTWTLETPTSDPVYQETFRFSPALEGGGSDIGWSKAVQLTHSFRTVDGGISKLVCLDAGSFENFDVQIDPTGSADLLAVISEWTDEGNAWAGRDTTRPAFFLQLSKTLNENLRRRYRMT